jgi:hypothetical protein
VRRIIQNYEIGEAKAEVEVFLIKYDEKYEDLLREATMAHEFTTKALWQYSILNESTIQFLVSSCDFDAINEELKILE